MAAAALTEGNCCWNHVPGLPQKDRKQYRLFDNEHRLFNALVYKDSKAPDSQHKHLWVKPQDLE